ncbi:MAG: class I SAM-dependent methyltransferase, partial [Patescibacteria group bacterium]
MNIQVQQNYYFKEKYASLERFISYFQQIDSIHRFPAQSLLFIGVGDSMVADFLKKKYQVTTIDIDPALKPDICGDIRQLPFKNNSFDLVCAFEVLEHIPLADVKDKAIPEIARVSRGGVIISVPHRRAGFEIIFKFPFIRTLFKKDFLRLAWFMPVRFPGFAISGQHYWEIDGWTTSLKYFRSILSQHFNIIGEK